MTANNALAQLNQTVNFYHSAQYARPCHKKGSLMSRSLFSGKAVCLAAYLAVAAATGAAAAPTLDQQSWGPVYGGGMQARSTDHFGQSFTPGITGTLSAIQLAWYADGLVPYDLQVVVAKILVNETSLVLDQSQAYFKMFDYNQFAITANSYIDPMVHWFVHTLDFSDLHIPLQAGTAYAFFLHSGNAASPALTFFTTCAYAPCQGEPGNDLYPGGYAFQTNSSSLFPSDARFVINRAAMYDVVFRTFVDPDDTSPAVRTGLPPNTPSSNAFGSIPIPEPASSAFFIALGALGMARLSLRQGWPWSLSARHRYVSS